MKILNSIKGKLILITLCISLIPIFVITAVYYLNARSALKNQILQQLTAITESKKIHTLTFMKAKKGRTIDFSSDGFIRDSLETIAQRGTQSNAVSNLNKHLKANKKLIDPQIKEIVIIGLDGIVVSSTNQRVIGNDVSRHELFVKSINNKFGESYVGRTYRSPYLNENCIFISAPITSKQGDKGETIGVIVNAYALSSLNEITANRIGMGKTGEVYLVNRDKVMITESRFFADAVLHQVVDTEPVRRIMRGDKGMVGIYPDYRGVSIVGASVDIPEYGWTLLAEVDKAEAFAPLWSLRELVLVMGGVCSAAAIAIGIIFSLSISRPINRLKYAAERIAKGNFTHRVDITRKDEIGALASSFNNMTLKLTQEIDERNHAEKALQESEEKSLLLLNSTGEAIYGLDLEGSCTFCNPSCLYLLGYEDESQLLGQNMHNLIHHTRKDGTPYPEDECCIYQAFREGKGSHVDDEVLWRADGTSFAAEYRSFPIFREGKTMGSVVSFVDITERIRMQEELVKAQKLESVGILAGGIAHDFNNSLQTILGSITVAELQINSNNGAHEYLNQAKKAVLQSRGLTQQLLTFSKGGVPVKKTVSVPDIITNSTKLALSGSNVKCEFDMQEDLLPVDVDEGQLNQVFNNLVINAVQAMPEGGYIKIYAENIDVVKKDLLPLQEGRYVKISVTDQGTGISERHLQKIFDPYFTTKQNGNGLGLATTYSIVKQHDGHIAVESEICVGTTFRIYLPASSKEIQEMSTRRKAIGACPAPVEEKDEEKSVSKGKILIMDDEYVIRLMLSKQLSHFKYEVEAVEEGTDAIRLYESASGSGKPFDAIVMDLTISGGMGGRETIKRLLEIDPEVKAIVVSGYANDPIMANYKEYGFRGVLAKPHEIYELDEILQKVIKEVSLDTFSQN